MTGLSGSGKSSLAFVTIYAEGQRGYVDSLSSYALEFLGQMDRPDVDVIDLSPAISIIIKTTSRTLVRLWVLNGNLRLSPLALRTDRETNLSDTRHRDFHPRLEQMVDRPMQLPRTLAYPSAGPDCFRT